VGGDDGDALQEPAHVRCRGRLARVRPQPDHVGGQGAVGAQQHPQAHRCGQVGGLQEPREVGAREHQHGQHAVGAVDEGQALLLDQLDRLEAGLGQGGRCGQQAALGPDLALPHHGQRDVGQRRQVAGAAEPAVLPDHRRDPGVQQVGVRLGGPRPDTGAAGGEGPQP